MSGSRRAPRYLAVQSWVEVRPLAPRRSAPLNVALWMSASRRTAPVRNAPWRSAPFRSASRRMAPFICAPPSLAWDIFADERSVWVRLAKERMECSSFVSRRSAPVRSERVSSELRRLAA